MTKAKVAITVSPATLAKAKKAVKEGRAASVSAFFEAAVAHRESREDIMKMLDEMLDETGGPLTAAERTDAERLLGVKARRRRKRVA